MPKPVDLAPSIGHAHLRRQAALALSYRGGPVGPWQRKARRKLRELLAMPRNNGEPLQVRRLWRRETELGLIEKLVFRSEPGVDVPCYWCVPHGLERPYPTFICLQGHSTGMHNSIAVDREDEKTPIDVPGDRDFALGCMKRGFAALCVEQRAFGLRLEPGGRHPTVPCHEAAMRALILGRTLVGERLFDVDRAIDYLQERGDVDMESLGILGTSTGGAIAMYAAALLPRIKMAIASGTAARFADTGAGPAHACTCGLVPGIMNWLERVDIFAAAAPKPMVIVNGRTDHLVPIASGRMLFRQLRKIYAAAGAARNVKFVEGLEGHRFYAEPAWDAMLKLME